MRILIADSASSTPEQGGAVWAVRQYVLGLQRLGHFVHLAPRVEGEFDLVLNMSGILSPDVIAGIPGSGSGVQPALARRRHRSPV